MRLYQVVTDKIVGQLESGEVPIWLRPWKISKKNGAGLLPINVLTGRHYHGINVPILWGEAADKAYPTNGWLTFQQAREKGAHVRRGEKATEVVFTKRLTIKDKESDEERQISMLRSYYVFNEAQVEGLTIDAYQPPRKTDEDRYSQADAFIRATGADIRYGGNEAAYIPARDYVVMPPFQAFKTTDGFYATELHECGHWTGAKPRLDRDLSGRFGTRAYAAEELIAEVTSAFLCAHLGIEGDLRHAGYVKHWAELLRSDNRAIFTAAAKAQQAADYLRAFSEPQKEEVKDAA
jgi:antirestriction protein ArdC